MCWTVFSTFSCRHSDVWKETCVNVKNNQPCMGRVDEDETVNGFCDTCQDEVIAAMERLGRPSAADKDADASSDSNAAGSNTDSKK